MNTARLLQLHENLKSLTLGNAARHLEERLRQAVERGSSYEEFLLELTDLELRIRSENREKRRLKEARFPLVKTLATFTFEEAPQLDKRLVGELAAGDYISSHRNVLVLVSKYTRYDLLIVDELGYVPFSKEGGELLLQVFAERHERRIRYRDDEPRIRQLDRGLRRRQYDGGSARPSDPQGVHHRMLMGKLQIEGNAKGGEKERANTTQKNDRGRMTGVIKIRLSLVVRFALTKPKVSKIKLDQDRTLSISLLEKPSVLP